MVDAVRQIAADVASRRARRRTTSTKQTIAEHLYTAGMPDPDLLIRTAGEMRISNFLLWQISYAEIWVTDKCWPEFDEADLHRRSAISPARPPLRRPEPKTSKLLRYRLLLGTLFIAALAGSVLARRHSSRRRSAWRMAVSHWRSC